MHASSQHAMPEPVDEIHMRQCYKVDQVEEEKSSLRSIGQLMVGFWCVIAHKAPKILPPQQHLAKASPPSTARNAARQCDSSATPPGTGAECGVPLEILSISSKYYNNMHDVSKISHMQRYRKNIGQSCVTTHVNGNSGTKGVQKSLLARV